MAVVRILAVVCMLAAERNYQIRSAIRLVAVSVQLPDTLRSEVQVLRDIIIPDHQLDILPQSVMSCTILINLYRSQSPIFVPF